MNLLEAQREAAAAEAEARILEYDASQALANLPNETEDPLHRVQEFINNHAVPTAEQKVTGPLKKKQTPVKLSHEAPEFVPSVTLNLPSETHAVLPAHAKSPDLETVLNWHSKKKGVIEETPSAHLQQINP